MLKLSRPLLLLLGAVALVPVAGCAGRGSRGDTSYVARDVATLYAAAKRAKDMSDY